MVNIALNVERSVSGQPWRWRRGPETDGGMDALVDQLLLARGVPRDDLQRHRDPRIRDFLPDPSIFRDMEVGAKRIADALLANEKIAIFGDYDVDGATSAALLVLLLRDLGADPVAYIRLPPFTGQSLVPDEKTREAAKCYRRQSLVASTVVAGSAFTLGSSRLSQS